MVTKDECMRGGVFHLTEAEQYTDSKGKPKVERWRSNGRCKTWVTRPNEFRLPVKFGLYGHSAITDLNADEFHREEDCPLVNIVKIVNRTNQGG
jgi:hypothetical protein